MIDIRTIALRSGAVSNIKSEPVQTSRIDRIEHELAVQSARIGQVPQVFPGQSAEPRAGSPCHSDLPIALLNRPPIDTASDGARNLGYFKDGRGGKLG